MKKAIGVLCLLVQLVTAVSSQELLPGNARQLGRGQLLPLDLQHLPHNQTPSAKSISLPGTFKSTGGVDTAWVRTYGTRLIASDDMARAVVADTRGNLYVTGAVGHTDGSYDFATVKYTSAGDMAWVALYDGPGKQADIPTSIALDKKGNTYVTGYSYGTYSDFATIKYDSLGKTIWVSRYDGPANGEDGAYSIAVDEMGNVYVTGGSQENADGVTGSTTIKYDSNGDSVWVRHFSGREHFGCITTSVVVDKEGNAYVAGGIDTWGPDRSYLTIKYNSAGDTSWTRQYNGPFANALSVDASGNVYVTGCCVESDLSTQYATIKYDAFGDTVWVKHYTGGNRGNEATSLAVDLNGNTYVTGSSDGTDCGSIDYATIKYDHNGDIAWARRYPVPNSEAEAPKLVIDNAGNVYVAGGGGSSGAFGNFTTIKYNSSGDSVWVRRYSGSGRDDYGVTSLAVDEGGNVSVAGSTSNFGTATDFTTIKYDAMGDTAWMRFYNGPGWLSKNRATAFDVDASGNVYITGSSLKSGAAEDFATVKYSPAGDTLWVRRYNGPENGSDNPTSLSVDKSGNVCVTGVSANPYNVSHIATLKYNSVGDTLWTRLSSDPGNNQWGQGPSSLAIEHTGDVFVTGSTGRYYPPFGGGDYLTIRYNSTGTSLWEKRYDGPGHRADEPGSIAVDRKGNVYVTGSADQSYAEVGYLTSARYATIKYDPDGDSAWARLYEGPGHGPFSASSVALDDSGNVLVTGRSESQLFINDYSTVKYTPAGDTVWVRTYSGPGYGSSPPNSLAVDKEGNVYVAGYSQNSSTSFDCTTTKYSPGGDTVWMRHYMRNGACQAFLTVDSAGNAYVTISPGYSDQNVTTIKYAPSGIEEWVASYPLVGSCVGVQIDDAGNVYVAGNSTTGDDALYTVIKYVQFPTSVNSNPTPVMASFALFQNYPNPFNPRTLVSSHVPVASDVRIVIYDVLGREVKVLVKERRAAGRYQDAFDASGLASGIYICRMTVGAFMQSRKMLLVK
jgi:uncharacterized delta-60 repeat protein